MILNSFLGLLIERMWVKGIRTITYGAHTSLVASERSGKFVTNVTTAVGHEICLAKCHKLATLMPEKFPYFMYHGCTSDYRRGTSPT